MRPVRAASAPLPLTRRRALGVLALGLAAPGALAACAGTMGKQDEPAIFDLFADLAGWKLLRSEQHFRSIFKPNCKLSGVSLAGLPGQMACYEMKSADAGLSTVVMVAADDEVGLVLSFHGPDLRNVQNYAVSALRWFSLERGRGDATLERWLQQ